MLQQLTALVIKHIFNNKLFIFSETLIHQLTTIDEQAYLLTTAF